MAAFMLDTDAAVHLPIKTKTVFLVYFFFFPLRFRHVNPKTGIRNNIGKTY